ncbi:MAG: S9 family peptidase, partial [Gemmatimonadales bacterium]|nr:S9 family peptidase [Gemmatimonadales bacterium]
MPNTSRGIPALLALTLALTLAFLPSRADAQDKPTLGADDYDQWERLGQASLSPDGLWLAVVVRRVDETSELRVHRTDSDSVVVVAEGARPGFGADGSWLAYAIGVSPDERDRLRERGDPVRNGAGLLNLRTGEMEEIEAMQSFSFSADGRYLALRRYGSAESESDGADVLVRDLTQGGSMSFGNVSAFAWQEDGSLLAMTVDAEDRVGNGVRLYDPESGRIRSLDAGEATYRELSWREDAPDLAVLKTFDDEAYEDTAHVALAWRGLDSGTPAAFTLDPRVPSELPAGTRIVEHRTPVWSDDGATLFLGTRERIPSDVPSDEAGEDGAAADGSGGGE